MKNKKYIDLCLKLKELSERGIGGEKDNATQKLKDLMLKYGITEEDIGSGDKMSFEFWFAKDIEWKFIEQVLCSIVGDSYNFFRYKYSKKRNHTRYSVEGIDASSFSEFVLKVPFYWEHFKKEEKIF